MNQGFNQDLQFIYNSQEDVYATCHAAYDATSHAAYDATSHACYATSPTCLLSPSTTSSSRTHDYHNGKQRRIRRWLTMPYLRKRYRKHPEKNCRLHHHCLVPCFVLAHWWNSLVLPILHRQLQRHRVGLCEMPNRQIQGCCQLLLNDLVYLSKQINKIIIHIKQKELILELKTGQTIYMLKYSVRKLQQSTYYVFQSHQKMQQIQNVIACQKQVILLAFQQYLQSEQMYVQPGYGAPPPAYYPPPPAPAQGPMIINLGNNGGSRDGSPCPTCGKDTGNIPRKKIGCITIVWCLVLFLLTGGTAWCYPFCTDSCKDTELVCVRCQTVKSKIPANCC